MSRGSKLLAVTLVILALGLFRLVHLSADTPPSASPTGFGLYVDEGYKTLAARRRLLFGATRWNPADEFSGWMKESALTQWSYYAGFRLLGPRVESARIAANPATPICVTGASLPPASITSASPRAITRAASPTEWAPVAQALT